MSYSICTLFEGSYHYGLGGLVNSLCLNGFRGTVWVGFRGSLPPWIGIAPPEVPNVAASFRATKDCVLHFILLETARHFTNFKPDFMQMIITSFGDESDGLLYFDPDIIVRAPWEFFEGWANSGIAVCQDVNGFMPDSHPIRWQWREFYKTTVTPLHRAIDFYVNGGFVGVSRKHYAFLAVWKSVQDAMEESIGGFQNVNIRSRCFLFQKTDQDALNIALMASNIPFSLVGMEGMDFIPGGYIMAHAIGRHKPWNKSFLLHVVKQAAPTLSDKAFWDIADAPIRLYSPATIRQTRFRIRVASLIGRFFRRS